MLPKNLANRRGDKRQTIVADADFYWTKSRRYFRQARCADTDDEKSTLLTLGIECERQARSLQGDWESDA